LSPVEPEDDPKGKKDAKKSIPQDEVEGPNEIKVVIDNANQNES